MSFIDYRYIPRLLKLVKWLKYSLVHSPPPLVSTRRIGEFSGKRWARMDFLFNIWNIHAPYETLCTCTVEHAANCTACFPQCDGDYLMYCTVANNTQNKTMFEDKCVRLCQWVLISNKSLWFNLVSYSSWP